MDSLLGTFSSLAAEIAGDEAIKDYSRAGEGDCVGGDWSGRKRTIPQDRRRPGILLERRDAQAHMKAFGRFEISLYHCDIEDHLWRPLKKRSTP